MIKFIISYYSLMLVVSIGLIIYVIKNRKKEKKQEEEKYKDLDKY